MKLVSLDAFDPEITFDINFKTYTKHTHIYIIKLCVSILLMLVPRMISI